ncbi:MAG: Tetraacyldisaccharide 4-kinase, partial [Pseudomonadota bacterium]
DGLQHPGLPRTIEIAVFDSRGAGNGRLIPAGPLREPLASAARMDAVLLNGGARSPVEGPPAFQFDVAPEGFRTLSGDTRLDCDAFCRRTRGLTVVAIAGIGAPQRFFAMLRASSIDARERPLSDHARIDRELLAGIDADVIVMTTKDAVKCREIADDRCWVLETRARVPSAFITWIEEQLRG